MKPPSAASQKRVTRANLAKLGAERLAELLLELAASRPDLKRRLRMELAAEHGAEALAVEIDRRLASLQASRSRIGWRGRATVLRDLAGLRALISDRLGELDGSAAVQRLWSFLDLYRVLRTRIRGSSGDLPVVFAQAAEDLGRLLPAEPPEAAAEALVRAMGDDPGAWADWLSAVLADAPQALAQAALLRMRETTPTARELPLIRQLADAARDVDAYAESYPASALRNPPIVAEVASRLLAAGRTEEAGAALRAAERGPGDPEFAWESAWIDYLEQSGDKPAAQEARWTSFERTLSAERLREFSRRLGGFDDVEAETKAIARAQAHPHFVTGLKFLMDWPALREAAEMIEKRSPEAETPPELAEAWSARLQGRYKTAAQTLLRRAAAAAFRRRDFKTCDRLTELADEAD